MSKLAAGGNNAALGTYLSYSLGFASSIALTIAAYVMAVHHLLNGWNLLFGLMILAVVQLFVQLVFFLHLGRGSSARWNLIVFGFMMIVVVIVVGGSLWIMTNLDYHHHAAPHNVNKYLQSQDGI